MIEIINNDCIVAMKEMADNSVDSIVTDPPYELGFMGKSWDKSGIAYNVEMWRECLRVLKPGGHLLAFGGTRTYHRMACAIEDAGFEIRDQIQYLYGSGFPKSLNIAKSIDGRNGKETGQIGHGKRETLNAMGDGLNNRCNVCGKPFFSGNPCQCDRSYKSKTDEAKQWEGWGTALKPANEPICLARKPLSEKTVAANVLKWGTGGLNIDVSRIKTPDQETFEDVYKRLSFLYESACNFSLPVLFCRDFLKHISFVLHSYSTNDKVHLHNAPYQDDSWPLDVLCAQNLVKNLYPNGAWCVRNEKIIQDFQVDYPAYFRLYDEQIHQLLNYAQVSAPSLHDALVYIFQEKHESIHNRTNLNIVLPSNLDDFLQCLSLLLLFILHKDTAYLSHPQIKTLNAKKWSIPKGGIWKPSVDNKAILEDNPQGRFPANIIHDGSEEVVSQFPYSTSGAMDSISQGKNYGIYGKYNGKHVTAVKSEGSASRFFYSAKASKSERGEGNNHPTVKPVSLMRYLCRLITPPKGIVLDPFMGSGSTGIGAKLEDFSFIGIEKEKDYCEIAKARIKEWQNEETEQFEQNSKIVELKLFDI